MHVTDLLRRAIALANRAVVETLRGEAVKTTLPGEPGTWWDTRPLLDPREHAPAAIDMAVEALSWGETTGLLRRHPVRRHLVRVLLVDAEA